MLVMQVCYTGWGEKYVKTTKIAIIISLAIMHGRKSIRKKKVIIQCYVSHLLKNYWQRSKKDAGRGIITWL
jgi:hypothetical protein